MSEEVFHYAYNLVDGQTWHLQTILNRMYESSEVVDSVKQVDMAVAETLDENNDNYQGLMAMLTDNQLSLLKAIARDHIVAEPTGGDFIMRNHLKTASSVRVALKYLENNELCYKTEKGYIVYDRFLGFWLARL